MCYVVMMYVDTDNGSNQYVTSSVVCDIPIMQEKNKVTVFVTKLVG